MMEVILNDFQTEKFSKYNSMLRREWFFSPDGIHGLMHIKRVLTHSLLLSDEMDYNENDTNLLCLCCIYHDIGRTNDYIDENHGVESCKKILRLNLSAPEKEEDVNIMNFIIAGHCVNDNTAVENIDDYEICDFSRAVRMFKLFKDCDALDRVRIDMLDENYLRYEQSKKYVSYAWELFKNPRGVTSPAY
jgi:hypothetical protein